MNDLLKAIQACGICIPGSQDDGIDFLELPLLLQRLVGEPTYIQIPVPTAVVICSPGKCYGGVDEGFPTSKTRMAPFPRMARAWWTNAWWTNAWWSVKQNKAVALMECASELVPPNSWEKSYKGLQIYLFELWTWGKDLGRFEQHFKGYVLMPLYMVADLMKCPDILEL